MRRLPSRSDNDFLDLLGSERRCVLWNSASGGILSPKRGLGANIAKTKVRGVPARCWNPLKNDNDESTILQVTTTLCVISLLQLYVQSS